MIAAVRVDDPGKLADTIAAHLLVGVDEKQNLLESIFPSSASTASPASSKPRWTSSRSIAASSPRQEADGEGAEGDYLNEKMKAIQKELGRKDEKGNEIDELKKRSNRRRCLKRSPRRPSRS